jgi:hypothetical protein
MTVIGTVFVCNVRSVYVILYLVQSHVCLVATCLFRPLLIRIVEYFTVHTRDYRMSHCVDCQSLISQTARVSRRALSYRDIATRVY